MPNLISELRVDTRADRDRIRALSERIAKESPYIVKPYRNSQGRVILNIIDPREKSPDRVAPFVVRDEAEWDDHRPKGRQERQEEAIAA